MAAEILDAIIIGAGHAGLSISYYLKNRGLDHIVFERGKIGDSWRNQRWDSFRLNTPNKYNLLPGQKNIMGDREGFCSAPDFAAILESYSEISQLPVIENCQVTSVERVPGSKEFSVSVLVNGSTEFYRARQIVVASGAQNKKNIPAFAKNITAGVIQLHASEYRNASSLPEGAVLVIGSAQSGVQISEDLADSGRKVFLSTSNVGRVPRRYRGKDIVEWLVLTGFYDLQTSSVSDPRIFSMKFPQISGVGLRGHTLSLQELERKGVVILGRMENADMEAIILQPDADEHVRFADESSKKVKDMINEYVEKSCPGTPPPVEDSADSPDERGTCASSVTSLNLVRDNITSIIWTTGFTGDFSYLKLPVFNAHGKLNHQGGVSDSEGLYFLGLPWLRKRKSGIIMGIQEDAEFIADKMLSYSRTTG